MDFYGQDPVGFFHSKFGELRQGAKPFVVATVIDTQGSASARTGSKAIFDETGKNIEGWVGGGCAEKFIGDQALQSLKERKSQIVTADMDDAIFGLGVVCGGKMQVFIEPFFPAEEVLLPVLSPFKKEAEHLAATYGWKIRPDGQTRQVENVAELFYLLSQSVAKVRNLSGEALRTKKDLPVVFKNPAKFQADLQLESRTVVIVGRSRITEALARHFVLLGAKVKVFGPSLNLKAYPEAVTCQCMMDSYDEVNFAPNDLVIIASHSAQDPELVKRALAAKAAYVGMIGSRVRALEVFEHLRWPEGHEVHEPLYVPAGLDIGARHPDEIALSVLAEIYAEIYVQGRA